jgi:hypothetical protein
LAKGVLTASIGYIGECKGLLQVLYERGHYLQGMKGQQDAATVRRLAAAAKDLLSPDLDAHRALKSCKDFATETTALQELLESRGRILVTCVKCHPELAGCGIEYSWGKSKMEYRKKNTSGTGNKSGNLQDRVASSLDIGSVLLPLERIWRFERRTRDYRNVYSKMSEFNIDADDVDHKIIARMVKNHKTHRNIVEIDRAFLH